MRQSTLTGFARIVLVVIAAALLSFALAPRPAYALEEGHHLHLGILNLDPTVARSNYTFQLELQRHRQDTSTAWIRVADYSTVKDSIVNGRRAQTHNVAVPADGALRVNMTVPFGEWSCGRHELRFTLNVNDNYIGNRQFTTSRTMISVAGCTTDRSGRASNWLGGGGGWYEGQDYAIGIQQSPFTSIRSGASTSWRVQSSASRGCLFKNPGAHTGTMGTQIGSCWTGTGTVTRTLPSLAVGDRVMLYAEDPTQHAGTYVIWVPASGASTYRVDYQDWWNTGGLKVP
jgi:hypothetical protein